MITIRCSLKMLSSLSEGNSLVSLHKNAEMISPSVIVDLDPTRDEDAKKMLANKNMMALVSANTVCKQIFAQPIRSLELNLVRTIRRRS